MAEKEARSRDGDRSAVRGWGTVRTEKGGGRRELRKKERSLYNKNRRNRDTSVPPSYHLPWGEEGGGDSDL